ncbi:MAG: glycerol-3-phosphate acyltransferase [Anaerolineales bacterium]|nr:glycerol-3-phosphate acyltransferase [Anaerolineales bacterium]
MTPSFFLAILAGYLLGSIPFAHLIASKVGGVRLAAVGSGNVGTRNLTRELGLGWGLLGGVLDFSKGLAAMALGHSLAGSSALWFLAGTAAVVGHNWPVWLRFRGGKGLATSLGAAAWVALWPELLITVAIGWVAMRITRNISLTAVIGFVVMLISLQLIGRPAHVTYFVLSLAVVVGLAALGDKDLTTKAQGTQSS